MSQQIREGRQHLHLLMGLLHSQLTLPRQSTLAMVPGGYQSSAAERRGQMREIENLGERLNDVAMNMAILMSLIDR